jgi:hypothetical protein
LAASASFTGIDQSPVKMTCVVIDGSTERAPRVDVDQHLRDRLGGDEAELLRLGRVRRGDAVQILAHADIAEIGSGVHRILVLVPQPAAVAELNVLVLGGHAQHVRVEIAVAGREQQRGAIQLDHAFHGLLHVVRLGNLLLLDDLHAGHLLQHGGGFGVGLVVAVIVLRADIDEANNQILRGLRGTGQEAGAQRQSGCAEADSGQQVATRNAGLLCHAGCSLDATRRARRIASGRGAAEGVSAHSFLLEPKQATCHHVSPRRRCKTRPGQDSVPNLWTIGYLPDAVRPNSARRNNERPQMSTFRPRYAHACRNGRSKPWMRECRFRNNKLLQKCDARWRNRHDLVTSGTSLAVAFIGARLGSSLSFQ